MTPEIPSKPILRCPCSVAAPTFHGASDECAAAENAERSSQARPPWQGCRTFAANALAAGPSVPVDGEMKRNPSTTTTHRNALVHTHKAGCYSHGLGFHFKEQDAAHLSKFQKTVSLTCLPEHGIPLGKASGLPANYSREESSPSPISEPTAKSNNPRNRQPHGVQNVLDRLSYCHSPKTN